MQLRQDPLDSFNCENGISTLVFKPSAGKVPMLTLHLLAVLFITYFSPQSKLPEGFDQHFVLATPISLGGSVPEMGNAQDYFSVTTKKLQQTQKNLITLHIGQQKPYENHRKAVML